MVMRAQTQINKVKNALQRHDMQCYWRFRPSHDLPFTSLVPVTLGHSKAARTRPALWSPAPDPSPLPPSILPCPLRPGPLVHPITPRTSSDTRVSCSAIAATTPLCGSDGAHVNFQGCSSVTISHRITPRLNVSVAWL